MRRLGLVGVAAALALAVAGEAQAASVGITGPAQVGVDRSATFQIAVDSAGVREEAPVLTVATGSGTCGPGPGAHQGVTRLVRQVPAVESPTTIPVSMSFSVAERYSVCAWLDADGKSTSSYASATFLLRVVSGTDRASRLSVSWSRTAAGRCRASGSVTPRGTGTVSLQRRSGGRWVTSTRKTLDGRSRFALTFDGGRKGARWRVRYGGSSRLQPATSAVHTVTRASRTRC